MARKALKVVNDLDLSGNNIIDLRSVFRSDYDNGSPYLDLVVRAGNDALAGTSNLGGSLYLFSGYGANGNGDIKIFVPNGAQPGANQAPNVTSEFGLKILGDSTTTFKTNSKTISLTTTAADINLSTGNNNSVVINSTLNGVG